MSKEQRQKYKDYQKIYQKEYREKRKREQGNINEIAVLTSWKAYYLLKM